MLLQDLYRVTNNDTWVTITASGSVFNLKYNGLLCDIPVSFLERQVKALVAIDLNQLLISLA